ncbi:hypothetical protein Pan54_14480 [Rubinisphaera italica]|uniref:Integrase catalytic domain-containing protein n=2 Tax=Rubinisphaera italica TaxID=2527969 RepID=A0A5C5XE91_9PLAN|nr:hypothetical protein Pan54_14480 [Rubinisphaera italica]
MSTRAKSGGSVVTRKDSRRTAYCVERLSQFMRKHGEKMLTSMGITCSMSRKGNCWEATEHHRTVRRWYSEGGSRRQMESFFATLKKELVHHERYKNRFEAGTSLFEYIEVFYNRVRKRSALGYLSPVQFLQVA